MPSHNQSQGLEMPQIPGSKVAAVIVTFNRRDAVLECLRNLLSGEVSPDYAIVVDNGSTDGTGAAIRQAHPQVTLVESTENLGPAGGFERGMSLAASLDCDWIMVLNDDCFVESNTLRELRMVATNADPTHAIIAPSVRHGGKHYVGFVWKHVPIPILADTSRPDACHVDMVTFSGALIRTDVVRRVGVPRGDYFMMWEEWEYCLRLRRHGYRVLALPGVAVRHLSSDVRPRPATVWREYYQARNHLRFVIAHRNALDGLYWLIREIKFAIAALLYLDQKAARIRFQLLGTIDALRGRTGRTITP